MIIDVLFWLPIKVMRHVLSPVADMLDSLAENGAAAAEEYSKEHGL